VNVSILTVSLNQANYLGEALDSVAAQTYPVEHIVVDGGSTDATSAVLEAYRGRLAHVIAEPDHGPADALNKALALASGEIFAYVNADDALLPGSVGRAVAAFLRDPGLDVVYGHGWLIDAAGTPLRRFRSAPFSPRAYALGAAPVMQQATFIRRAAALDVGGFNVRNSTCWDSELLLEIALAGGRFLRVNEYWGLFRLHGGSISGSSRLEAEYRLDRRRLFERATGRPPRRADRVRATLERPRKWLKDPAALSWRISDALRPPRPVWRLW
jgi:glycosyltransferase involved in cell wall biosynthesis